MFFAPKDLSIALSIALAEPMGPMKTRGRPKRILCGSN